MTASPDPASSVSDTLPLVSVVCAWYNRADYLCITLDSLLAQTCPSFEIVLVNDGSTDPRVREILDGYNDPRLTVIHQDNAGFPHSIRRAIKASQGQYIAIQGAGDISFPSRLERQARFLSENPDFVLVGCKINNFRVEKDAPPPASPVDNADFDGTGQGAGTLLSEATAKQITWRNPFSHGEVMMRRSAYDAVGGYRVFFTNAQDVDLWLRMLSQGRQGVLKDWLYQRNAFIADGIATNLRKLMVQLSFSLMAAQCHDERAAGRPDSVERYGTAAMLRLRNGIRLRVRILRRIRQAYWFGTLDPADLSVVRELYGVTNYLMARLLVAAMNLRRR